MLDLCGAALFIRVNKLPRRIEVELQRELDLDGKQFNPNLW
jgi:hypothetical protein